MTPRDDAADPVARLAARTPEEQTRALRRMSGPEKRELTERWWRWALEGQFWPEGDWRVWLILAGRGFGKTRAGAEWLSAMARTMPEGRFALVGANCEDVRKVMVEGASGLIAVARDDEKVRWLHAKGEVIFASGARAFVYSAETPGMLRGPEHHLAWCDELAKWRRGDETWDNLMLGLRLGQEQRTLVTTTPRSGPLLRRVRALATASDTLMRGRTRDNIHLPPSFVAAMIARYGGTRLGRQELDGELIEDVEGALWTRERIEGCRVDDAPPLARVVVAVDPPASAGGDACGIVAAGIADDGLAYVIEDASVGGASPERWAGTVADCYTRHRADRVVAEKNQGGDMVASVLKAANRGLPITLVHASRGKAKRAEPVAALYESGRVRHVGALPALEDELCGMVASGRYEGPGRSPDRADALVWALTDLMLEARGEAAIRLV